MRMPSGVIVDLSQSKKTRNTRRSTTGGGVGGGGGAATGGRGGGRRGGSRAGGGGSRRAEPVDDARHQIMRAVAGLVGGAGPRQVKGRLGRREIPIIEIDGEVRRQIVAQPADRLIPDLPGVAVEKRPEAGFASLVRQIGPADAGADMRLDQPAEIHL